MPTVHVLLLVIGISSMVLSWRWLIITMATAIGVWSLAAWLVFASDPAMPALGSLFALAMPVALFIHHRRLRSYRIRFYGETMAARHKELLQEIQGRYESAVRGANDGLWFWDLDGGKISVSARWSQMAGCPNAALSLTPEEWWGTVDRYHLEGLKAAVEAHLQGESAQLEYKHRLWRKDETCIWVLTRGLVTYNDQGAPISIAGSMTDITHVVEIEEQLVKDALQDKLTGLWNRHALMIELAKAAERSREARKLIAVAFIDLDDFKLVNDNLGHLVGDRLLAEVAQMLRACTRPNDMLARYGGDEFVLLLENLRDASEAEDIGRRIREVLSTPIDVNGNLLKVTACIGVAVNQPAVWQADELLRNADVAMYESKARGKGQLGIFNSEMQGRARRSWDLYNVVRDVVEREECLLNYQPIVSITDGRICGAEALFRCRASLTTRTNTGELIVAAEKTGAIVEIGRWVLTKACADLADWRSQGLKPIPISVNVSAHQLRVPGFSRVVESVLRDQGIDPCWLQLELTETAFMHDTEIVCANLRAVADLGVGLAVDDFGTGYSNLGYLAKFPLKTLKIDGSFVRSILHDPRTAALTKGLISLAHGLGLSVTAEQVESVRQLDFLTAEGCDCVQGYLTSPPLAENEIARILGSDESLLRAVAGAGARSQHTLKLEVVRPRQSVVA
ncbi:MAG: EAL domain-containing protein [Acidobacteriia bacterium]|nr:EAL domain-containing protein [Terriglobia bacterium]